MTDIAFGPAIAGAATFTGLPLSGAITSFFGSRDIPEHAGGHTGVDIGTPAGTPVRAPAPGLVRTAAESPVFGKYVTLAHAGGWESLYAHLSRVGVLPGQYLRRGDGLGLAGSTGLSTGPHLHWGLAVGGSPLAAGSHLRDPLAYLSATPGVIDVERTLGATAHAIYGALQAAGAALGTRTEADFALYPPGSPERAILDVQRAANPLIARYVRGG
ncbi:MAG: M23 family metallopeptidase [Chloroflexi bacterium]|nr:M23 family metallopeptidase [Chloroflexota bacterium]